MNKKSETIDLAIVGAGPAGYPAAFRAADLGMKVALIDPRPKPGGVCLFNGCIPSKVLLHTVKLQAEVQAAAETGLQAEGLTLDPTKLRKWKDKTIRRLTGGLQQMVKQRGVDYIQGTASFQDRHTLRVSTESGTDRDLSFEQSLIATGSQAVRLPGIPEDSSRIVTSRQALELSDIPHRLLVVGGGYIGLELGQVYAALGARVTVVEMLPQLLAGADRDLAEILEKRLRRQFEAILCETKIVGMNEGKEGVRIRFQGRNAPEQELLFDLVLMAVGRRPDSAGLNLDKLGVETDRQGFVETDEQGRTAAENIFAAGDVAGSPMLAHKATHQAIAAVEAAAGRRTAFAPQAIPCVVFTDPEVAWTGLTEQEARQQGSKVKVAKFPWAASGRAATLGRADGLTKLIVEAESQRVLGAGIAGVNAGELIGQATLAIEMGAVAEDLALSIQAHPTLSETLMEAAEAAAFGQSIHLFKAAP